MRNRSTILAGERDDARLPPKRSESEPVPRAELAEQT